MALPNIGSLPSATDNMTSSSEDPSKKVRKPYTIRKSRESWTEPEHDKFLEALQLFDRDWKKIEAFVGSKTVIQIRSHAQKYFLKVQKSGTVEHLPPPRPKRKAAHPYPQKAPKIVVSQAMLSFQASPAVSDPGFARRSDSSSLYGHPDTTTSLPTWLDNSVQAARLSHVPRGNVRSSEQRPPNIYPCSSNECTPKTRSTVLPDFAEVYSFIGSVFDPTVTGHLQKLKKMDRIDIETILLLIRNLSINLASPDFEDHRRLLSSYEIDPENDNANIDTDDLINESQSEDAA